MEATTPSGDISYTTVIAYFHGKETLQKHNNHPLNDLTLIMLSLLLSKAQIGQNVSKISKPCYVDIYWKALAECFQMSTNLPGFLSFSSFFAFFYFEQISHQQQKG